MAKNKKRHRKDRKDAYFVRDLDAMHAFMPYIIPDRVANEAVCVEKIDITELEKYLEKNNSCVLCPLSIDRLNDLEYPSHRFNRYGIAKSVYCKNENKLIEVDIAISSGTTLTMDTFNKIGYYDEDFFIDFVDIEWCIRARKKNIPIFIAPDIKMYHSIGDNVIKTKLFTISSHSPIRTYYKVRNSFLLSRKKVKT